MNKGKKLASGAGSTVYLDADDDSIVIKESRYRLGSQKDNDYISHQLRGYDIADKIRKSGMDVGVVLPELIEYVDTPEYRAISERRIAGVDFKEDIYAKLSEEQKEATAHQMALFLNVMHQMYPPKPADKSIKNVFDSYRNAPNTTRQFETVFEGHLSPEYVKRIAEAEQALLGDISDEVHVMTHKDLRNQNIMYDVDSGRVAVIDFEMAGIGNIYRDFVAASPGSSMSWDFTQRVIRHYNAIENKKYPITIDANKVKNALIYGIAHEHSRVLNVEKQHPDNSDMDIERRARLLEHRLETLFGHDLFTFVTNGKKIKNMRDAHNRAIAKVKKKTDEIVRAIFVKNNQTENN